MASPYRRGGKPSSDSVKAGVLVHMFDHWEDWEHGKPWDLKPLEGAARYTIGALGTP